MIHYQGLPITPESAANASIRGGHAFVSHRYPEQLGLAVEVAQSFAVDNGAFSAWIAGTPISDWSDYYKFVADISRYPSFDFTVIPDVIDGSEEDNDELLMDWPHGHIGAPVWHMHESPERFRSLCESWPIVCIGSSGEYSQIGTDRWWHRMSEALLAVVDSDGFPIAKLHGLRMLDPEVFTLLPLHSADSTNIGRNVGIDSRWSGPYSPTNKATRALVMRDRIESVQAAQKWTGPLQTTIHWSEI